MGFVDTFREINPEKKEYSYWSNLYNAKAKGIGWRIDYILISKNMAVLDARTHDKYEGSDHIPVSALVSQND